MREIDMKEFEICARHKDFVDGPIYKMAVFAKNDVVAKSRLFRVLSKTQKVKRASAEVVSVKELVDDRMLLARSYGVWIRVYSNNNPKNMYKEFRETSRARAAAACFAEMERLYKLSYFEVDIVQMAELTEETAKREEIKQYMNKDVKFPSVYPTEKPIRHKPKKLCVSVE